MRDKRQRRGIRWTVFLLVLFIVLVLGLVFLRQFMAPPSDQNARLHPQGSDEVIVLQNC